MAGSPAAAGQTTATQRSRQTCSADLLGAAGSKRCLAPFAQTRRPASHGQLSLAEGLWVAPQMVGAPAQSPPKPAASVAGCDFLEPS